MQHLRQRLEVTLAVVLLLSVLVIPTSPVSADTEAERERVQQQRATVAAEIDTLRASDQQIEAALIALQQNVEAKTTALASAEQKVAESEAAFEAATDLVRAKETEIAALQSAVQDLAISAYVHPPSEDSFVDKLSSETIGDAELKQSLLASQSTSRFDVLDQLERARQDLETARQDAEAAAGAAETHRSSVETELVQLTEAREAQARVLADVENRLNQRLSEADALATLDAELAEKIRQEQAAIAAQLAAQRAAAQRSTPRGPSTSSIPIVGRGSIVSVRGIEVHESIADNVGAMLNAAEGDGIALSGWGYRDPEDQIRVRRNNCGSSNYAIYQAPSSSCSPPTAPPGYSMHERGLAIDFTYGGRTIGSRSSPAYQWLAAHAAGYGLYNLPSEPWHWSINGR